MDRNSARTIRATIERALADALEAEGLSAELAPRATFDPAAGTVQFKLVVTEEGAVGAARSDWDRLATVLGCDPSWFEQWFVNGAGERMQVVGINGRAKKFPVRLKGADGKGYKASATHIRSWSKVAA